jgi:hypothetical protein
MAMAIGLGAMVLWKSASIIRPSVANTRCCNAKAGGGSFKIWIPPMACGGKVAG